MNKFVVQLPSAAGRKRPAAHSSATVGASQQLLTKKPKSQMCLQFGQKRQTQSSTQCKVCGMVYCPNDEKDLVAHKKECSRVGMKFTCCSWPPPYHILYLQVALESATRIVSVKGHTEVLALPDDGGVIIEWNERQSNPGFALLFKKMNTDLGSPVDFVSCCWRHVINTLLCTVLTDDRLFC